MQGAREPAEHILMEQGAGAALAVLTATVECPELAIWGATLPLPTGLRVLAAVGTPMLAAIVWGLFCAPQAAIGLPHPWVIVIQLALLACEVAALTASGHPRWAIVLAVLALGSTGIAAGFGTGMTAGLRPR